jgi:hypothetical protein
LPNVKLRLEAWREAEHRRDGFALGSPEWQEAEDDARSAAKAFHAEVAQATARYAEEDFQGRRPWSAQLDRRTSGAGGSVADASLARWPQP